eukprot:scaffold6026_cov132-Isochrysis_galbana.AAC.2
MHALAISPISHLSNRSAIARVRASGPRMLAWITYGGPDGLARRSRPGRRRAVLILLLGSANARQ